MKHWIILAILLASTLTATTRSANAQTSRVYFAGYAGFTQSPNMNFTELSSQESGDIELKNAPTFAGALGLRFSRKLRAEAEIGYISQNTDRISSGSGDFELSGDISVTSALLNLYYDFDVPWRFQPYVGAGIGAAWVEADLNNAGGTTPNLSNDSMELAWQLTGGLRYRMSPDLAFTGGYRYFDTTDLELGGYDIEYANHEFRIGLEYDIPVNVK